MENLGGFMMRDKKVSKEVTQKKYNQAIPLQRFGTKKEIADACVFLCSDAASYITGEMLVVDGGSWLMSGGQTGNMYFENPMIKQAILGMRAKRKQNKSKL